MDNDALLRRIALATDARSTAHTPNKATIAAAGHVRGQPVGAAPTGQAPAGRVAAMDGLQRQPIPAGHVPPTAPAAAAPQHIPTSSNQMPGTHTPTPPAAPTPSHPAQVAAAPVASSPAVAPVATTMTFMPPETIAGSSQKPEDRERRPDSRGEAFVVSCNGTTAVVQGDTACVDTITGLTWAVGRMLSIKVGENRIVGMICDIEMPGDSYMPGSKVQMRFQVELQGEVQDKKGGGQQFTKGITAYPGVGSIVHQIRTSDLASIYAATGTVNAYVGNLSQDSSIPALVDVPDMLSKHFSVLGSTGCGKSASVSLLLHAAQELVPDMRTIILDPHNEYSRAFPKANTVAQATMDIPFWMFQLEEYVEVLFRGKPIVHEEVDALREFLPEAKVKFRDGEDRVKLRSESTSPVMTADTAAPYRMADLLAEIEEEMGLLESRYDRSILKSLKARINAHCHDSRYAFMFRHRTIEDIAQQVIGHIFSLPGDGSNTTIIQMAGMPAEVVNAVASVLCRLSFELAIAAKGNLKILVVCEEAHRYVPAGKGGFEPTRRAIARIAKEGRKYGAFMAIVSQRPSELDPTILSQCSTVFSLRLTNDFDQDIIRRAISSSSASTVAFISSLSNRECIAFGEGMSTPMRMRFRDLPGHWLPGAESDVFGNSTPVVAPQQAQAVFQQWRSGGS
jgi:DNA helicase HerA-like ATPase